ncbi:GntR family transcriptional regulator [Rhodanobacter sp. B2A1Ga4]|uniref:GntR family transcriptional regulator n=1 Tax=Rhodanobacter TaxID=75309 RepID=UPI000D33648C|nr:MULTISPECIES: GntR family transcriptional regulator [Rhodanobacter]MBQ4856367.1 GntR family transcriptional regulator [Rhodanobacter sp. B2A1Ga4]
MPSLTKQASPLYLQLANDLREGILSGRWNPGDTLPSEPELCRLYGISRGTVVRAVEMLIQEGLVQRRQGAGTYVSRPALHRQPGLLASFSETVRQHGRKPSHKLLKRNDLTREQALQYGCTTAAVQLLRLRFVDGTPWSIHNSILPMRIASRLKALAPENAEELRAPDFSLYRAYTEAGIPVDHAEEILHARAATAQEARLLKLPARAVLMTLHRKSYDADSGLLEIVESDYAGESYSYTVSLAVPQAGRSSRAKLQRLGWKIS